MDKRDPSAAALRGPATTRRGPVGLPPATQVMTLDGILPVEHLYPGDRVITRRGALVLNGISRIDLPAGCPVVEIAKDALGGRPDRDLWLPADQRVLLRDWRAVALYGAAEACVPVARLVDGEFLRLTEAKAGSHVLALSFGSPEVLYCDGLELASADPQTVMV